MSQLPDFQLASAELGRQLLCSRDDFVVRLSPFDRAARLHRGDAVSEPEFLAHVGMCVRAWSREESALISSALEAITPALSALHLPWPGSIQLIRSDGREEGGAPYTRGQAIVLPDAVFARGGGLPALLLHELFHVLTRHNRALKQALYASIGFMPRGEQPLPASLMARKITNPDAPFNDFHIRLEIEGQRVWALPLLLSDSPDYDPVRGGEFFDYLGLRFLFSRDDRLFLAELHEAGGFYEQVGRNTEYILHPEEILADNFALLLQQKWDVPSPQVLRAMAEVLSAFGS